MSKKWAALLATTTALLAQQKRAVKTVQSESPSSFTYGPNKEGYPTIDISDAAYEVVGEGIPGRPTNERLVLRMTIHTKQVVDEIGMKASTTVEAWPVGVDLKQKPLYSLKVEGVDPKPVGSELLSISRGLEDVQWWSVYKLATGQHLFDTYVPLVPFSISREIQTMRYAGLEVPPDDAADARLKEAHVVAVLTYASAERVIREALVTSEDPKQAILLRSYADASRWLGLADGPPPSGKGEPGRSLKLIFFQNYPAASAPVIVTIPIAKDDLDLAHAQLPPRLHLASWKR
ncbi:MAG TPA: hypothetical protein VMH80_18700 [Bryobacteraceae bacterium]|nr:hypothetical protein [Bryobacteraceae bacterium]